MLQHSKRRSALFPLCQFHIHFPLLLLLQRPGSRIAAAAASATATRAADCCRCRCRTIAAERTHREDKLKVSAAATANGAGQKLLQLPQPRSVSVKGSVPKGCFGAVLSFYILPLNILLNMKQMQRVLCSVAAAVAPALAALTARGPPLRGAPRAWQATAGRRIACEVTSL